MLLKKFRIKKGIFYQRQKQGNLQNNAATNTLCEYYNCPVGKQYIENNTICIRCHDFDDVLNKNNYFHSKYTYIPITDRIEYIREI